MNIDHYKLQDARKQRENMNIDRMDRRDAPIVWAVIVICLVTFGYLAVFDERFNDVKHEVRK